MTFRKSNSDMFDFRFSNNSLLTLDSIYVRIKLYESLIEIINKKQSKPFHRTKDIYKSLDFCNDRIFDLYKQLEKEID